MNITVYGIKNCDTMKKAFQWLNTKHIAYDFHDYKKQGVNRTELSRWIAALGWRSIINTRGTTWRNLDQEIKESVDHQTAVDICIEHPSVIKRPVLVNGQLIICGFQPLDYEQLSKSTV